MIKKYLLPLIALLLVFSVSGVYAIWLYAESPLDPAEQPLGLALSVFDYSAEEVLPGGENEDPEIGQNHLALIELILNDSDYGLNNGSKTVLHDYLEKEGAVYSNQKVSGGNLRHLLNPTDNTHMMYYCLEKVSDTVYYAYTFSMDELSTAGGTSVEIVAYRTVFEKTDQWAATISHHGHARTRTLSDLGTSADPNAIPYSIDMSTWYT